MKKLITSLTSAAIAVAVVFGARAAEVTPGQAQTAAKNWVKLSPKRMDSVFRSAKVQNAETVFDESGRVIFHVVNLEGGGFVVTAGDTRLSPIVAFSTTGSYAGGEGSALGVLLKRRLARAVSSLPDSGRVQASSGLLGRNQASTPAPASGKFAESMAEWDSLLAAGVVVGADGEHLSSDPGGSAKATLSDVRVGPLLKTKWWQGSVPIKYQVEEYPYIYTYTDWIDTFNYYTPNNYVCGCVATAGAQVMYYWKAPSGSIAQFSNTCYVDGVATVKTSLGGTFDWNNMFTTWTDANNAPSETQRKAVGKLSYDVGVAVGMSWSGGGSSASLGELVEQLKSRFGYKSGTMIWYDIEALNKKDADPRPSDFTARLADFKNALYASLDAKMPVFLSIGGADEGEAPLFHAVVVDGYGYDSGKLYTHVNFGYNSSGFLDENVWYYMPDDLLENYYDYTEYYGEEYVESECYYEFEGIGFNVHPTLTGDVISGRVLNASGSPVSGATVTLYNSAGNAVRTATTDAKGIYSVRISSAGSYSIIAVSGSLASPVKSISIPSMTVGGSYGYYGCRTGNSWGNDLKLSSSSPTLTIGGGKTSMSRAYSCEAKTSESFSVASSGSWTATASASWITIASGASGSGNGKVTYSLAENTGTSKREGTIKVKCGSITRTCTITQDKPLLIGGKTEMSRTYDASKQTDCNFTVTCSQSPWTAVSSASWVTLQPGSASGTGTAKLYYNVTANTTTSSRTATIKVTSRSITRTCTITQKAGSTTPTTDPYGLDSMLTYTTGGDANWHKVSQSGISYAKSGAIADSQESYIKTTVAGPCTVSFWWKVSSESNWDKLFFYIDSDEQEYVSGDVDWEQKSYSVPSGLHSLKWSYIKDSSQSSGDDCGCLERVQTTFLAIGGGKTSMSRAYSCETKSGESFSIACSDSWTATASASWIKITSGASGSGNGTVKYSLSENTGTSKRDGKITIKSGSLTRVCTITQDKPLLIGGKTSMSRTYDASKQTDCYFTVTCSQSPWTAVSSASWLTIKTGSASGTGTAKLYYNAAANTSSSARTATIKVTSRGLTRTCTIKQNGK